jgi:hypothetical protein
MLYGTTFGIHYLKIQEEKPFFKILRPISNLWYFFESLALISNLNRFAFLFDFSISSNNTKI